MPPWPPDAKIIARFPASCRKRPFCEESCPPKGGQKNFFRRQRAHVRYLFPRIRASVGAKPTAGRAERPTHHTAINTPHSAQRTASAHQHIAHHAQALAAPGSNTAGVAFIAQRAPRCVTRCYHHRAHHHTPPLASASMSHTIGVTKTSSQTQSRKGTVAGREASCGRCEPEISLVFRIFCWSSFTRDL